MDKNIKIWLTSVGIFVFVIVVASLAVSQHQDVLVNLYNQLVAASDNMHASALTVDIWDGLQELKK